MFSPCFPTTQASSAENLPDDALSQESEVAEKSLMFLPNHSVFPSWFVKSYICIDKLLVLKYSRDMIIEPM
jgi:hypothetical protein